MAMTLLMCGDKWLPYSGYNYFFITKKSNPKNSRVVLKSSLFFSEETSEKL